MEVLKLMQAKDFIVQILRDKIFSGILADGEELAQELLAEELGVSRMPVREALQTLELEGLLERLPNRHMRVIGIRKVDILHNFRILSALESELASMLLEQTEDISTLIEAFGEYKADVFQLGQKVCTQKELAFHMQISILLGDRYLIQLHQKLLSAYLSYALSHVSIEWRGNLNRLQEILEALENKQQASLRELFDEYFEEIAQAMIKEGQYEESASD